MRGGRIPYSAAEMQWLADNRTMVISDYHRAFVATFDRQDITAAHLHSLRKRLGWKVGRAKGRLAGRRQRRRLPVSATELQWLQNNCTVPIGEYHSSFCAEFSRTDLTAEQLHSLRKREGWSTGRTGRFEKGSIPWTKGRKLPFNAGSARTQFKRGGPRSGNAIENYRPIGSERMHESGFLERKVNDDFPMQARWQFVHRINWEAANGPVPAGMVLKCKGSKTDTNPSNFELVPRGVLARLNKSRHGYDQAPAELKPTIMAVAKLQHGLGQRRKQLTAYQRPEGT